MRGACVVLSAGQPVLGPPAAVAKHCLLLSCTPRKTSAVSRNCSENLKLLFDLNLPRWDGVRAFSIKTVLVDPLLEYTVLRSSVRTAAAQIADMKSIVFAAVLAVAVAAPQFSDSPPYKPEIRIISQRFDMDPQGNYEYGYEQDNGQKVSEVGSVYPGSEPETGSITMQGEYEYVGDDGNTYQTAYVADTNGFQPQAAHLPQAPAQIPEYAQLRIDFPQLFWADGQQQYV